MMQRHKIVSADQWIKARKELLRKEKQFTRLRDDLSRRRRALPWAAVEKAYVFDGAQGQQTLSDLFDGRSQLIVYHFMLAPRQDAGCPHPRAATRAIVVPIGSAATMNMNEDRSSRA
jgi:predicted dithiol-disulfide oxidoreductase (DUF899 family)